MFRALVWKEWRQLVLVRWGGIALGALLPVAFNTGAELAKRGLLPTGNIDNYSPRDLLFEILPAALALGLWPLIALMSASQAFSADRAAGTETFILERPVPRGAVWRARIVASVGTLFVVIIATAALGVIVAALAGAPPGIGWSRWQAWSGGGVGIALLALVGGMIASSLIASPMGAVLGGGVLAGLPVLLAAQLSSVFALARVGVVPLGAVLPILLLPGYVAASWSASSRGEPAGRGRVKRGVTIATGSLCGVLVLFALLAPLIVRAAAASGSHGVLAEPTGRTVFVRGTGRSGDGGWIVDVESGAKRAFVPPPLESVTWSPDRSELAVVTWAGPLGAVARKPRIEIRRVNDGGVARSFTIPEEFRVSDIVWARGGLVAITHERKGAIGVHILDAVTGNWRATGFEAPGWGFLDGPRDDGRVLLRIPLVEEQPDDSSANRGYEVLPIDASAARVGAPMVDSRGQTVHLAGWAVGLSPSGRFALEANGEAPRRIRYLRDLQATTALPPIAIPSSARWLAGDRLVWHEDLDHRTRLFIMVPGSAPVALREWADARIGVEPSPDRNSIFVSVLPAGQAPDVTPSRAHPDPAHFQSSAPSGTVPEEFAYRPDGDRWTPLAVFSDRQRDQRYTQWAGPHTIARIAVGVVYFEELDKLGERHFVLGSPSDLR